MVSRILFLCLDDVLLGGAWSNNLNSWILLVASEFCIVPGILFHVSNGITCTLFLFFLVVLFR